MEKRYINTKEELKDLGSALTIEGLCEDSIPDLFKWIEEYTPLKRSIAYITVGKVMNELLLLTGDNKYPDDLTIVSVKLEDMENYGAVIIPRFSIGGRWMDDIISNNIRREQCGI